MDDHLLSCGCSVGRRHLELAVRRNNDAIVKLLLQRTSVGINTASLWLCAFSAVNKWNPHILGLLLDRIKENGEGATSRGEELLAKAAESGIVAVFETCLGRGFDQESLLVDAVKKDDGVIVYNLLKHGTNPDVPSCKYGLAVSHAFSPANVRMAKCLLEAGAHILPETLSHVEQVGDKDAIRVARQFPLAP